MGQSSYKPSQPPGPPPGPPPAPHTPEPVVGPEFCFPYVIDLEITKKVSILSIANGANFAVTDSSGNVTFKVKGELLSLRDKRILIDPSGNLILTLREKAMTLRDTWRVFRGDSTQSEDLLFSVKRSSSSLSSVKTILDVFLADNIEEDVCDFKLKGSKNKRSCTVIDGESSTVLARMHKERKEQNEFKKGKHKLMVTVYPHVDYAFIVAVIIILQEIDGDDDGENY